MNLFHFLLLILFVLGLLALGQRLRAFVRAWQRGHWSPEVVDGRRVPVTFPVEKRRSLFARSEREFYGVLKEAVPEGYVIFAAVRLQDLFQVQADFDATYARLRDKHVDFLLVREGSFAPVLGIELDGVSHQENEQRYRDAVKEALFRSGGLPLVRFEVRRTGYAPEDIAQLIEPYLLRKH